tara:strand:- start:21831 stop:22748 length:918 start_codon:yes stop_codon:yes gene_type:complete
MKIFLNSANESWVVDRFREEWIQFNTETFTENIEEADIVWIIAPWAWRKIPKKYLKDKKVVCTIHHIDFEKFNKKERKNFNKRDRYVDIYHSISSKTTDQITEVTNKEIVTIPFWINQNIFYSINENHKIKSKYGLEENTYYIGSFQRDTEGKDLISPKLSKGPDRLSKIFEYYYREEKNVVILLTGKRRNYIINELKRKKIPYKYFEMVDFSELNELYNCLNLYIVASRIEGGPQAILECGITKTPIISTDVGIASKILDDKSIFSMKNFAQARTNIDHAFDKSLKYKLPNWLHEFNGLFKSLL